MPLFDPQGLISLTLELAPSDSECQRRLALLQRLARAQLAERAGLTETRVEQSFNERIFSEVFGYTTLFSTPAGGAFDLLPKSYHDHVRRFDDFTLGFFGTPIADRRVAIAEFKSPGADLDKEKNSHGENAVEQAHKTASLTPDVEWILVSNFDEVRLYRSGDQSCCETLFLTKVDSVESFRRAYTLLGRRSLLGTPTEVLPAPLTRLLTKGTPVTIDPKVDHVRIIHEAIVPNGVVNDAFIHKLDDALTHGLNAIKTIPWPKRHTERRGFDFGEDRVFESNSDASGTVWCHVELTNGGILRVQEIVGRDLLAPDLALRMATFIALASQTLYGKAGFGALPSLHFRWRILDTTKGLGVMCPPGWLAQGSQALARLPVDRAWSEVFIKPGKLVHTDGYLARTVTAALRDLLYAFEWRIPLGHSGTNGPILLRPAPTESLVAHAIAEATAIFVGTAP